MERRLVKQGRNALTVTIPAEWIKSRDLKPGDSVFIEAKNTELSISSKRTSPASSATIDAENLESSLVWHYLISRYIEGFDEIIILNLNRSIIPTLSQHLIGMIIHEQTPTQVVLKSIIHVPENNFEAVFRRAVHMFVHQASLLKDITEGKSCPDEIKEQERMLDANIYYAMRYLTKYENYSHTYRQFLLCSVIEEAADQLSNIAKFIGKRKDLAKDIHKIVELYSRLLFSKDLSKLYLALRSFRNSLNNKSFVDGLAYSFADTLYNNLGYLLSDNAIKSNASNQYV